MPKIKMSGSLILILKLFQTVQLMVALLDFEHFKLEHASN